MPSSKNTDAMRSLTPVITMLAAYGIRKLMTSGYEHRTGKPAPLVSSQEASVGSRVMWTVAVGATVALAESLIWEWSRRRAQDQ
ncbi:MAG: hypothetical protein ACOYEV_11095 [Candidatus Nanopelagicales bacterium]